MPVMICAALASCGANDSSSVASKEEISSAKTTKVDTNSQADKATQNTEPKSEITAIPNSILTRRQSLSTAAMKCRYWV